jgi:hypothetical protein
MVVWQGGAALPIPLRHGSQLGLCAGLLFLFEVMLWECKAVFMAVLCASITVLVLLTEQEGGSSTDFSFLLIKLRQLFTKEKRKKNINLD